MFVKQMLVAKQQDVLPLNKMDSEMPLPLITGLHAGHMSLPLRRPNQTFGILTFRHAQ